MATLVLNSTNILQIVPALNAGGVEQTVVDISEAIVAEGGRAMVASAGGRLEGVLQEIGAELYLLPVNSKNPFVIIKNRIKLKELILRKNVSLVHARSRAPAWSAAWAARECGIPFVTTYHGIYNRQSELKRRYNSIMAKGDLVIANSEFTRRHIIAEHGTDPDRIVTIPRGVDLDKYSLSQVTEERKNSILKNWGISNTSDVTIFLMAARLTRWKGHELIVEAVSKLEREVKQRILIIFVGEDQRGTSYRNELLDLISKAHLQHTVRLFPHCDDMPAAYSAADFVLSPSIEPEAFGKTVAEAQAMERPVLASQHGAPAETVLHERTGWHVPVGNVAAWARAIERAANTDANERNMMGRAARLHASKRFSLTAMIGATLEVYGRLLR